jgi:hypothetical protein
MILRLGLNEMDLQRSKQMLALLQRQPDHSRRTFGHGRATADLMNANGPVRSDQLQHDPPLHPQLPATTTGRSHSTPHIPDGLVGQVDLPAIANENANIDQIVATLDLKEMTQGTLIRKLCTYTQPNPTRRAIFEFDKLVRSIYTLRYLRNPQLQRDVQRSQNRLESYHQLRAAIAQVGGEKELAGKTDIEISNQCARLIANAIIYYNSAILSRLLAKYGTSPSVKALAMIKKISPAAWRHIHLNGRYTFRDSGQVIDLDALVAGLNLT